MKSRSYPAQGSRSATPPLRFRLAFILFITQVVLAAAAFTAHAADAAPGECVLIERQGKVEFAPRAESGPIFSFYMGKNTPERKDYIMDSLVVPVEE